MFGYQALVILADCYTPLLMLAFSGVLLKTLMRRQWLQLACRLLLLGYGAVVTYGLMFADRAWSLWQTWGLDYSTHTAAALVLVVLINHSIPRVCSLNIMLLVAYAGLMLYQQYHSVSDILTTAAVVLLLFYPVVFRVYRFANRAP